MTMDCKSLKASLKEDKVTIGSWVTLGHTSVAEIMAERGFDWLTIDMEHSAITMHQTQQLVQIIELSGVTPVVRVGENNPNLIKRAMDTGAHGVIVPMVNTKDDAERAVSAARYPPEGTRGVGLARAQEYGFGFEGYKEWVKKESVVIVQVEHIDSINNLEEILSVPGVDGTFIGPYDLSGSLGRPGDFDMPEMEEALKRYEEVSKRLGVPMGVHVVHPDPVKVREFMDRGYRFIAVGLDTLYMGLKIDEVLAEVGATEVDASE